MADFRFISYFCIFFAHSSLSEPFFLCDFLLQKTLWISFRGWLDPIFFLRRVVVFESAPSFNSGGGGGSTRVNVVESVYKRRAQREV
jgi:hypothetical protein